MSITMENDASKTGAGTSEKPTGMILLEQFVLLAKSAKGAAAAELVKQVLETPGINVFGELLDMPNIIELQGTPNANYFNLLSIFAFGTYRQYLENKSELLELSPAMKKKLQLLTIVTLSLKSKCIPYSVLLHELDIPSLRDMEDLVIDGIYAGIIKAKLDQKNSRVEVDWTINRDVQDSEIPAIIATLEQWCDNCETMLVSCEEQINKANAEKTRKAQHREATNKEIANIMKTLKIQENDTDEAEEADPQVAGPSKTRKQIRFRGGKRGSGLKYGKKSHQ